MPPSEAMRSFETFEHTADIGLVARGGTLEELFANAAMGLVDLIADPSGLRDTTHMRLTVSAPDREALLVAWLNELLYLLDSEKYLPRHCRITRFSETGLTAELWGERVERGRHTLRRLVKAATYHELRIIHKGGRWEGRVVLDL
jgi:SHS2 domain-containing protein